MKQMGHLYQPPWALLITGEFTRNFMAIVRGTINPGEIVDVEIRRVCLFAIGAVLNLGRVQN